MKIPFFIAVLILYSQLAFSQLQETRALQSRLSFIKDSIAKNDALNRLAQLMAARQTDSSYNKRMILWRLIFASMLYQNAFR